MLFIPLILPNTLLDIYGDISIYSFKSFNRILFKAVASISSKSYSLVLTTYEYKLLSLSST